LGDAILAFNNRNSDLGADALSKVRSGMLKLAAQSKTYEVVYSFFDFYSHYRNRLRLMTEDEETKEKSLGQRLAVTDTTLGFTTTTLQSVVLGYGDTRLAALLLHELAHQADVGGTAFGEAAYQEGHAYVWSISTPRSAATASGWRKSGGS
jgi:predicted aminopeptidase